MSINFPTFVDKEIPGPEKFNAFVQALEAKFTAGLGSAEIQWPLVSGGNLVMSNYEITGGKKILKVVNAADSAYSSDFSQALVDASGGVVFIPPGTTIQGDGLSLPGNSIAIIGAGPDSVLQLSGSTAGYLLRSASANREVMLANLTIDGNNEASDGVVLRGVNRAMIHNVRFKNFGQVALHLTSVDSTSSRNVIISNCSFNGGGDHHILGDDCEDITVQGCQSDGGDTSAFEFVASGATASMRNIDISNNVVAVIDQAAVVVRGGSGTYNTLWANINISDNVIDGSGQVSGPAIECGAAAGVVQHFSVTGNQVYSAVGDAIKVYGKYGHVSSNNAQLAGQHGINCTTSAYLSVIGNDLQGATNVGVQATNASTDVVLLGNNVLNCNTGLEYGTDVTAQNNVGGLKTTGYYATNANSITIPANRLSVGSRVVVEASGGATGGSGTFDLRVGSNTLVESGSAATGDNHYSRCEFVVTAATIIAYHGYAMVQDNLVTSNDKVTSNWGQATGYDLTAAITVTSAAPGLTHDYGNISVQISSAEEV